MWRIKKRLMGLTTIKRNLINSRMVNATAKTRRIEPKLKEKEKLLNAINVVVQTTLIKNVDPLPQHLVKLYQRSLKESNNTKRSFEAQQWDKRCYNFGNNTIEPRNARWWTIRHGHGEYDHGIQLQW
jgi:hypothetical protein